MTKQNAAFDYLCHQEAEAEERIRIAGAMTEEEMRNAPTPKPKTEEELIAYIHRLVERPHSYGTCVYAMSLAAVAAFEYVAHRLGVTGFQASCADLQILYHTRHLERGNLLDYNDLLYPKYCTDEHFPSWKYLIHNPEIARWLKDEAEKKLRESPDAHPTVKAHWIMLTENEAAK